MKVLHSPTQKFGASRPTVQYQPNLEVPSLENAIALTQVLNQQSARIQAMGDQKDPLKTEITVGNGEMSASVQTRNSGEVSLQRTTETVQAFVETLLQKMESLIPTLRSDEEILQEKLQSAKAFWAPIAEAVRLGNYTVSSGLPTDYGAREGLFSMAYDLNAAGRQYQILKVDRMGKIDYTFSAVLPPAVDSQGSREYQYLHLYRDGTLYDYTNAPEMHYRLYQVPAGKDISLSTQPFVQNEFAQLMNEVLGVVARLEKARKLRMPGDPNNIQV